MNQPQLEKRRCACPRHEWFTPTRNDRKYASAACAKMAYRARKSLQSTAADKATWIKKLSDRAYLTYSALIRVSEHIAMHYWSMYVDCGIEFVEAELNLIGSAIGIVITDATEHGSQELTNAGHQYWFIQPDIVTVTTQ